LNFVFPIGSIGYLSAMWPKKNHFIRWR